MPRSAKMGNDATPVPTTLLPDGTPVPALGQGTWNMGEHQAARRGEIAALQLGFDLGMTLIDTAEMYADGGSEEVVGEAIAGRRDAVFLVSKVLPSNATRQGTIAACERSLKRLRCDQIDLYLLHWRGGTKLAQTVEAFDLLLRQGKIARWGVSNFDVDDMDELVAVAGGAAVQTDQILYNLTRRGIEHDLLPWCAARRMPVMAYSPLEQGRLLNHPQLAAAARRHQATAAQIALAWVLQRPGLIAAPKSGDAAHVRENRAACELRLTADDHAALDYAFPPPHRKSSLAIL